MTALLNLIETALYAKLSGHAALTAFLGGVRIYEGLAPRETALPYVIFQYTGGGDLNDMPTRAAKVEYRVECIAGSLSAAHTGAGHIEDALRHQSLSMAGWSTYWLAQTEGFKRIDMVAGQPFYRSGAYYAIAVSQG